MKKGLLFKLYLFWSILLSTLLGFPLTTWAKSKFESFIIKHSYAPILVLLGFGGFIFLLLIILSFIFRKRGQKLSDKSPASPRRQIREEVKDRLLNAPLEKLEIDIENFPRGTLYYRHPLTGEKREYHLTPARDFLIGRAPYCQVHLRDPKVSREHALIRAQKRGYMLYDLASRRGIFVNGKEVKEHLLQDGEVISLEAHLFEVQLGKEQ